MIDSVLAIDDVSPAPETYDGGAHSSGSIGKSRPEKGQSFADSPAFLKAKAERQSGTEVQANDEDPAEDRPGETDTPPAANEMPVEKGKPTANPSRNRCRSTVATNHGSRPKAQAVSVERVVALGVAQAQQAQPAAEKAVAQQPSGQPIAGSEHSVDDAGTCPVVVAASVQDVAVQVPGQELAQAGQLPAEHISITASITVDDAAEVQSDTCSPKPGKSAANASATQPPTVSKQVADASGEMHQKPAAEAIPIDPAAGKAAAAETAAIAPAVVATRAAEVPPANPAASEVPDKTETVGKNQQQPVHELKPISPVQANPQTETEAGLGRNHGDSAQTPTQTQAGASRPAPMEGIATMLSAGKEDMQQIMQGGPGGQPEISTVFSGLSPTTASHAWDQGVAPSAPEAAVLKNPAQDLTAQLGNALRAGVDRSDKQLTIRLQPPELGSVVIRLEEQDQQIKAVLEVSRSQTGKEIEQALPQVVRNLHEAGLQVRKIDVVVSDQLGKDTAGNSSSHDAWNQHQAWSGTGNRPDVASRSAWSSWNGHLQTQSDTGRARSAWNTGSPGGIDLLA